MDLPYNRVLTCPLSGLLVLSKRLRGLDLLCRGKMICVSPFRYITSDFGHVDPVGTFSLFNETILRLTHFSDFGVYTP